MKFFMMIIMAMLIISNGKMALASSQDACAIWICLPGGFPSGCGGAYSEFKKRIKKGRDPLPKLSSCTTGPNGEKVDGHYQLGYERFEPCDEGYVLREKQQGYRATQGLCYRTQCAPQQYQENYRCENYQALIRPKPHYVKMWVNGEYLGQYFYQ
jgi:hypothetical protein